MRLGGLRPQGVRRPAAPRRHRDGGGRGACGRLRPLDLRRAAVDRDGDRPAQRHPGGDQGMTTTAPPTTAEGTMISLVGSLADNKAALGRAYADWAVSAPTLESAVAAAAMAQDELGHARSTYPVLKALGTETDEVSGGDRHLALLDEDLPDWNAFIAANLLVDGVLTTFVAACVDSSVEQMAARAKKILQEEGSHRVHGEAWAKRLCRGDQRDAFLARLLETWEHAGRWIGPDDDP